MCMDNYFQTTFNWGGVSQGSSGGTSQGSSQTLKNMYSKYWVLFFKRLSGHE